jgi:hypothetical protein
MEDRNFAAVLKTIDALVPAGHAVRANGWDSVVRALQASLCYTAPEAVWTLWNKLTGACQRYFDSIAKEEAWPAQVHAVLYGTPMKTCHECCGCHPPSKQELDAMIKAHPDRLIITGAAAATNGASAAAAAATNGAAAANGAAAEACALDKL